MVKNKMKKVRSTTNYVIGDFLIRIKNAAIAGNKTVEIVANQKLVAISEALKKMGFLDSSKSEKGILTVALTYKNKRARLIDIKLVSKPGLRVYMGVQELTTHKSPSVYLISTPKGMMSSLKAIKDGMGGEVIAEIW